MPAGKTHTKINLMIWLISLLIFLRFQSELRPIFNIGIWTHYFSGWDLTGVWFCLYSFEMYIHTKYLNPDIDTHSDATKLLGIPGKLIDWVLPHRGPSHSILVWSVVFVPLCWFVGTWCVGGFVAGVAHIVVDWISTAVKRNSVYKFFCC